ncbi:MAG: patatin-like phospholipase family protein [Bdellovibrionales bacterium]|nr:patatin-like phospholipase family protein [Bdellovibrionales bacterium]
MPKNKFRTKVEFSKAALVFSGGATKAAAFHVGVCLALRDKGFSFVGGKVETPVPRDSCAFPAPKYHPHQIDTYVGSSAGALIVTMLAAGISVESLINSFSEDSEFKAPGIFKELPRIQYKDVLTPKWPSPSAIIESFKKSPLFAKTMESLVLRNLRLPGIFTTKGLAEYLQNHVLPTEYFHELKANLFVVGTQLDHSRKIIFCRYATDKSTDEYCQYASFAKISDAVAGSMSLPPIFAPHLIPHEGGKDRYYIDGEIRETLSTHVAKENGADLIICSYTHQPYHYSEKIGSLYFYGLPAILIQTIYQSIEQKVYGAKRAHENKSLALQTIRDFFATKKYPEQDLQELTQILQERLDFKEKLNYVFIHPEPKDREMFFGDHFTLAPAALQQVVNIGYKRAMSELRRYDLIPHPV